MRSAPLLRFPAPPVRPRVERVGRAAMVVGLIAVGVMFVTRSTSEWDTVFVGTAARLAAGEDIYETSIGYVYPPLQAAFGLPAVGLPRWASRLGWFAANAGCLLWLLHSARRLCGWPGLAVGLAAGVPFLVNCLSHQQSDVILAALVAGGCVQLGRDRGYAAATLFGLAAAMKCTPLLFAPYLLARRRPGAAGWVLAVAVGASLVPDLVHRPATHSTWLAKWYDLYLAPMAKPDYTPGVWASEIVYNQSLVGAANRWTHTSWAIDGGKPAVFAVASPVGPTQLKRVVMLFAVAVGVVGLLAIRRGRDPLWDVGLVASAMLLLSPMSSPAHFGVLLLPGAALGHAILVEKRRYLLPFAVVMLAGALAVNKDLVGRTGYTLGLWYGLPMWAAAAGFLGSAAGLAFPARRAEPLSIPEPLRQAA